MRKPSVLSQGAAGEQVLFSLLLAQEHDQQTQKLQRGKAQLQAERELSQLNGGTTSAAV